MCLRCGLVLLFQLSCCGEVYGEVFGDGGSGSDFVVSG